MKKSNQACFRYQLRRMAGWSCLYLLFCILALTSATAAAIEIADLNWQPATCRAAGSQSGSNPAKPDAAVFVNATEARQVLTTTGAGHFMITSLEGKQLTVHVFRPSHFDARTGRIWFVMHGTGRSASRYLQAAIPVAERYQVLTLVVEFSRRDYPSGDSYTLGVADRQRAGADASGKSRWRSPLETPYAEIERIFSSVSGTLQNRQPGYFIFGHSAGAQFVHRLLTFYPCPRVIKAVAANAGWYTLPTNDKSQPPFPYSLRNAAREFQDPRPLLAAPLTILLGTRDTLGNEEDHNLRASPGAMAQGVNRFERGKTYYEAGLQAARNANVTLAWKIQLAPDAGHNVADVIALAGQLLFAPVPESTCCPKNAIPTEGLATVSLGTIVRNRPARVNTPE